MSVTRSTATERRPSSCASANAGNRWPPVPPAASMTDGGVAEAMLGFLDSRVLADRRYGYHPRLRSVLRDARQLLDQRAERIAAHFEVAVLIEGGAGRREQHDRLLAAAGRG